MRSRMLAGFLMFAFVLLVSSAVAQPLTFNEAVFLNPQPPEAYTLGVGTSTLYVGVRNIGNIDNLLHIESDTNAWYQALWTGEEFPLGEITYSNGDIVSGTEAQTVDLRFTLRDEGFVLPTSFDIPLHLQYIQNHTGDPILDADAVVVYPYVLPPTLFYGGTTFSLLPTRFVFLDGSGSVTEEGQRFNVWEGASARAVLMARWLPNIPIPFLPPYIWQVTGGDRQICIDWYPGDPVDYYEIQRKEGGVSSSAPYEVIGYAWPDDVIYTDYDLPAGATFTYRLFAQDNQSGGYSNEVEGTTLQNLSLSGPSVSNITPFTATVTWRTNLPADSVVEYGLSSAYGQSIGSAQKVMDHSVTLSGLSPATLYHYRVRSTDDYGRTVTSADSIFVTRPQFQGAVIVFESVTTRRGIDGRYTVTAVLRNTGDQAPAGLWLTASSLGAAGSPQSPFLPKMLWDILPGSSLSVTLVFPSSAGVPGSTVRFYIGGRWGIPSNAGFFGTSVRTRLP